MAQMSDTAHLLLPAPRGVPGVGETRLLRRGDGTPVVLIHGVGMNASVWVPQLEGLSAAHDVIAYDVWGHGGATLPAVDAVLADYATQLASVLDACGLVSAHIVGHSMGALIGLEFALAFPGRARSVVALNAVYCRDAEQRLAVERRAANLEGGAGDIDATLARWFDTPVPPALRGSADLARHLLESVDPVGYGRAYRVFATSDRVHEGRLVKLGCPALFMTGEFDPNSTPAMSEAMAAAARDGMALIQAGHRHMLPLTGAEQTNAAILGFLAHVDEADDAHRRIKAPVGFI